MEVYDTATIPLVTADELFHGMVYGIGFATVVSINVT
jgi:hypothetical protein